MTAGAGPAAQPLLDLPRLVLAIRRRKGWWLATAVLGLLAGGALATLAPPPPTAVARLLIIHEEDQPSSGGALMRTDIAVLETARVAAAALERLGSAERPEDFLKTYKATGLTNNVLELKVSGGTDADAVARAKAVADAFIADHVQRVQAASTAEAQALLSQRDQAQQELAAVDISIAETTAANRREAPAELESLYARRAELDSKIAELGRRADEAAIGTPRVPAGTQIVDAPRAIVASPLRATVTSGAIGLVLGLVVGLGLAAVTSVVRDRPLLRREIAEHLAASVIAQLRTPRRFPPVLLRRRAVARRKRVAATLARAAGDDPAPVSLLDLGARRTTVALAGDLAERLAADTPVVIVDDLRGGNLGKAAVSAAHPVRVAGSTEPAGERAGERQLGVGSVAPGTAWTDLRRLGAETVLVVRAGHASTAWLHTVARQLADLRIPVIGVVLVDPDPRDRSDGTLWDALHTALRGRSGSGGSSSGRAAGAAGPAGPAAGPVSGAGRHAEDHPTERFPRIRPVPAPAPVPTPVPTPAPAAGATNGVHTAGEQPAIRFDPVWPTAEDVEVLANVRLFGQRRVEG